MSLESRLNGMFFDKDSGGGSGGEVKINERTAPTVKGLRPDGKPAAHSVDTSKRRTEKDKKHKEAKERGDEGEQGGLGI
jgi:hypothetical protein